MLNEISLLALFLVMIVQVIVPPIPATLIVIAAGKVYGVFLTTVISGAGLFVGYLVVYYFAAYFKKRFPRLFDHKYVKPIMKKLKEHENLILWIRILPYNPADSISYAAGLIHVKQRKFWINSFIVSFVRCYLLALMGVLITDITTAVEVLIILTVSGLVAYFIVYDRQKKFKLKKFLKESE